MAFLLCKANNSLFIELTIDNYLSSVAPAGSYVSMIADEPAFYEMLGYKLVSSASQGMRKRFKPHR